MRKPPSHRKWRYDWKWHFNLNMEMLLRMQAWHDASEMRKHAGKIKISPYVPSNVEKQKFGKRSCAVNTAPIFCDLLK